MAHNAALQRADAASDPIADAAASLIVRETGEWGPCGGASAAMGAGLGAGQTGSEAAVEAFRRRMRERQAKVEGVEFEGEEVEVLKRALWDCLRRRVEGLEEDAWMFEVEAETRGEGT